MIDQRKKDELHTAVANVIAGPEYQPQHHNGQQVEPTKSKARSIVMRRGDTINDAGTRYLWHRRIVIGSITVIFSRPGRGKSTLGAALAGHVTRGKAWPDGAPCPAGEVFYIHGEGTAASIRDRMMLAGADAKRYHLIGRADDDQSPMIDLANDVPLIEAELSDDVRLLIVDTLDSLFPSMRMIDNANIRRCLWPLQDLAERLGLAVVIFAHTNKGGYADPMDRLSGGRAIGGAARSIWYLGKLDHDDDACFITPVKANDFSPGPALEYQIVGTSPDLPGAIRWAGEADVSAWDLDRPPKPSEGSSKAEDCTDWLRDRLAGGPVEVAIVEAEAKQRDYGRRVMKSAKSELGVTSKAAKGSRPPVFYMLLPGQNVPDLSKVTV